MSTALHKPEDFAIPQLENVSSLKIGIVTASWHGGITGALRDAAVATLKEAGLGEDQIYLYPVPGSYELPMGCQAILNQLGLDAVIAIGCLIQGETRHFEFIADAVTHGLMNLALASRKPVIYGLLTTDTEEQAWDRAGGKLGNKGTEWAIATLQMLQPLPNLNRGAIGFKA